MKEHEAFKLLTLASARDNRTVSQSVAAVWASDLGTVPFADAVDALTLHYRERPDTWLQPGHVVDGARRVRMQRERDERVSSPRQIAPSVITLNRAQLEDETAEAIKKWRAIRRAEGHDA